MAKPIPIFYNAMLLTTVNLILRLAGTSFQVYISRKMGAAGVGLLQLTMSVGGLALVTGMAGVRTAAMYLTAGELGRKRPGQVVWVLSGCVRYSLCISLCTATLLFLFAPSIAALWIGETQCTDALRLLAVFLPITCLCGVMTGYFTAACRIRTLAAVEVAEQIFSMVITMTALNLYAGSHAGRACQSVILGSGAGSCLTLTALVFLRIREHSPTSPGRPVYRSLLDTALPLGAADVLRSGISTVENLMVPKRLALCTSIASPLAAFGILSGMVFPVLMFPACILFALAELLIPELSRCSAAGSTKRICYLVQKCLRISLGYGVFFCGLLYILAEFLCLKLYSSAEAVKSLRIYALLIPMLYCDAIVDAMTKGLGQQKACVRYNILTSALDVLFLFFLLPRYGMAGYFISFTATHLLNFLLSLRRLLHITGLSLSMHLPVMTLGAMTVAIGAGSCFSLPSIAAAAYAATLVCLWTLFGIIGKADIVWLKNLINA